MQSGSTQSVNDVQNNRERILQSIRDNNVIFISAQPDSTYFHWQVEIYLYQFAQQGVLDRCYALFGYQGNAPTEYAKKLAIKYPCIRFYKDTRLPSDYAPTIRPHILAKFFKENPNLGKNVFYHDSDIFLTNLPRFDLMLQPSDTTAYLSDTISYIGYNYIKDCSERYKRKYPNLRDDDIFYGMCDVVGIDYETVKSNEKNSGGAQYLLKNIDYKYWEDCEEKCYKLYEYLSKYEKAHPISNHIQKWTTDMWVVLWLYWKRGGKTIVHKDLDFSWATGTIKDYNTMNIFHLAGITGSNSHDKFHKGLYTKHTVFNAYFNDPTIFDHIDPNNATFGYVNVIKKYVREVYLPENGLTLKEPVQQTSNVNHARIHSHSHSTTADMKDMVRNIHKNVKRFEMICNKGSKVYEGVYALDETKKCEGKHLWRSEDKNKTFIIFWSGANWVLTYARYEAQIGPACGGIISSQAHHPYINNWNIDDMIIKLH